jgi:glycosyltransferase involved in cell wall biosynthesis
MQESALVTVIVPCYNYAHYLGDTLASLVDQTYSNWECIIVDDGSTDNTKEVAMSFVDRDPRYVYIYQENKGLPGARNTGMKNAKGIYFQYLDADDLLQEDKLKVQSTFLNEHPEVDIVYGDVFFFTNEAKEEILANYPGLDGKIHMPRVKGKGPVVVKEFLKSNIKVNTPLVRKTVIDRIGLMDESLVVSSEDWKFWLTAAINSISFYYNEVPGTGALVRAHEQSVSMPGSEKLAKTRNSTQAMFDDFYKQYASKEYLEKTSPDIISEIFGKKGLDDLSLGKINEGIKNLAISLRWGNRKGYYAKNGLYYFKEILKKKLK